MGSVTLLLGIHNHQPVGNFESVFEEAYQKAYLPWARTLLKHPSVKWNLHCTGILWEFLESRHPEYLDIVREMAHRGQVEILTGGFYEPILATLPDADKLGQIKKLTRYIEKKFKVRPEGFWCAERVWEPHLPKALEQAGVRYTVLDDSLFQSSGIPNENLTGYYRVEDGASSVDVFPIAGPLRFMIPFQPVEKSIEYLKSLRSQDKNAVAVMADDGEKFGLWPETYKSVYEDGWLDEFFEALETHKSWLKTDTFSNARASSRPQGRAFLPSGSYPEMDKWAKGIWRNFLAKYPESNNMYKKMLRVSGKVHRSKYNQKALDRLWAGQCNCAYWHGTFGGLYYPILRQAIYRNLIEAENELDRAKKSSPPKIEAADFDGDGADDLVYESRNQNLYVSPAGGGTLFEWDFKPAGLNVLNVLTRTKEPYHNKKAAEDWHRKTALIDHFFHPETTQEAFTNLEYGEQGDFVTGAYVFELKKNSQILLKRKGWVSVGTQKVPIEVQKTIKPFPAEKAAKAQIEVSYAIKNLSEIRADFWFCSEMNLAFAVHEIKTDGPFENAESWERTDPHLQWAFAARFSQKTSGWVFPLETTANSIDGIEKTFQGLTFAPHWKFTLDPGESFQTKLMLTLSSTKDLK